MTAIAQPGQGNRLDGVPPLRSAVCRLAAEDGVLRYRGYDVRDLALNSTFEETGFLLVHGELPNRGELREWNLLIRRQRRPDPAALRVLKAAPPGAPPIAVLRSAVSALGYEGGAAAGPGSDRVLDHAIRLIAQMPTLVAAIFRLRAGQRPVGPKQGLGLAANFLWMLHGAEPDPVAVRAFDAGLILRADNELNPSTFAARVAASTGADLYGALTAALAVLAGPRHGGHTVAVIGVLEEIGAPDRVDAWVRERMRSGVAVPAFGHPVYQGEDPRTAILRELSAGIADQRGTPWYAIASALERRVVAETGKYPIVDFYLAPLYRALALPTDLFTAVFAVSRTPGWVAHTLEQYGDSRLIRPRAEYVGPADRAWQSPSRRT